MALWMWSRAHCGVFLPFLSSMVSMSRTAAPSCTPSCNSCAMRNLELSSRSWLSSGGSLVPSGNWLIRLFLCCLCLRSAAKFVMLARLLLSADPARFLSIRRLSGASMNAFSAVDVLLL